MAARRTSRLYDVSGEARRLRASPLLAIGPAAPGPALRRGALVAAPIALSLAFEFSLDWPSRGAIATAALICGFTALDAPAGPRAVWQAATAPLVGLAAALGVLSSQWAPAAAIAMGSIAALAGFCFADTLRLAFSGLAGNRRVARKTANAPARAPLSYWPASQTGRAGAAAAGEETR